jgi:hypothetical protein
VDRDCSCRCWCWSRDILEWHCRRVRIVSAWSRNITVDGIDDDDDKWDGDIIEVGFVDEAIGSAGNGDGVCCCCFSAAVASSFSLKTISIVDGDAREGRMMADGCSLLLWLSLGNNVAAERKRKRE